MSQTVLTGPVPVEAATQICSELRQSSLRKLHLISALWCWGCTTFTKGETASMCGGVVACPQVVARYERGVGASDLRLGPSGGKR